MVIVEQPITPPKEKEKKRSPPVEEQSSQLRGSVTDSYIKDLLNRVEKGKRQKLEL